MKIEVLSVFPLGVCAGLFEPFVLVGTVVYDQVHDDVEVPFFGLQEKAVHILHGTEARVYIIVIGDVVPLVGQGRAVDRRQPYNIHAEIFEIIELFNDAWNISDPVAVGIIETFGINLVCDFIVPPLSFHFKNLRYGCGSRIDE